MSSSASVRDSNSTDTKEHRLTLSDRQLFDLDQILVAGFTPLRGFLKEDEYHSVVEHMRLPNGELWPIPIVLDVSKDHPYKLNDQLVLCDTYGNPIARFRIESIYLPNKEEEAKYVYGTASREHPGVRYLMEETGDVYLGGAVEQIGRPPIHDFRELRRTPQELKAEFTRRGWNRVVAFQTRNPMHRAHVELVRRAAQATGGKVLVHPVVGLTKEGDIEYVARVRGYKRLIDVHMKDFALLSLLPIAMRMAGPREALWHALIRKNYGATHFIIGRDHASPGLDSQGVAFYDPYAAHALAKSFAKELGITLVLSKELAYVEGENRYVSVDELQPSQKTTSISGTQFRQMLRNNALIPEWFSYPEVVEELRRAARKEKRRGVVIFFTGLSGAGKSTIAHILYYRILEHFDRSVTLLDGDVVRTHLSKGLGFSREDRDANIARIGFVAAEIAKHGGIAICAAVAPYAQARDANRRRIEKVGTYLEVFVRTPLTVCEQRDTKGLYKKARRGMLKHFTGIDDPYEEPMSPELVLDTMQLDAYAAAEKVFNLLTERGLLASPDS